MLYLIWRSSSISNEPEMSRIAFDNKSGSIISLNNSTVLYLKEISPVLALVCIIRKDNFKKSNGEETCTLFSVPALINYTLSLPCSVRCTIKLTFSCAIRSECTCLFI